MGSSGAEDDALDPVAFHPLSDGDMGQVNGGGEVDDADVAGGNRVLAPGVVIQRGLGDGLEGGLRAVDVALVALARKGGEAVEAALDDPDAPKVVGAGGGVAGVVHPELASDVVDGGPALGDGEVGLDALVGGEEEGQQLLGGGGVLQAGMRHGWSASMRARGWT